MFSSKQKALFISLLAAALFAGCGGDDKDNSSKKEDNNSSLCGNGKIDAGEDCDGDNLNDKTCQNASDAFISGKLTCNKSCKFDTTECVACTDNDKTKCGADQICSNGRCEDQGYKPECGNSKLDENEQCEGTIVENKTCRDLDAKSYIAGELKCNNCSYDVTGCIQCTDEDKTLCKEGQICENNICVDPSTDNLPKVVISQIYPGGGNLSAIYKEKYIELLNIGNSEVDISNWSIQYSAATSEKVTNKCAIPENTKIPKGGFYLIALKSGNEGVDTIPPDHTCNGIGPAGDRGKFYLVDNDVLLTSYNPESGYADAVGYGSANWSEGNSPAPKLSAKLAGFRKADGCTDTNNNANDFETATPNPRNSASEKNLCDGNYTRPKPASDCEFEGQEFVAKYSKCAYPLSTTGDIQNLFTNWNNYSANGDGFKEFYIKNDIDFGKITATDNLINKLSKAVIYGNDKTITAKFVSSRGLFKTIDESTIQDLTFKSDNSRDSMSLFAEEALKSTFKNITFNGTAKIEDSTILSNETSKWGMFFGEITDSEIDTILLDVTIEHPERPLGTDIKSFGGFAKTIENTKLNKITLKGEQNLRISAKSISTFGFAVGVGSDDRFEKSVFTSTIKNSTVTDLIIETKLNTDIGTSFFGTVEDCKIDRVIFNPTLSYNAYYSKLLEVLDKEDLIDDRIDNFINTATNNKDEFILSNFEDRTDDVHDITNVLKGTIANAIIITNYFYYGCDSGIYANVVFTNLNRDETQVPLIEQFGCEAYNGQQDNTQNYSVYYKDNLSTITAASMNQNLKDKKEGIPSGAYLPWIEDSGHKLHLNFDANDSEKIVVP